MELKLKELPLMGVNGRTFNAYLSRKKNGVRDLILEATCARIMYSTVLKLPTNRSQMRCWGGTVSGWELHLIPLCGISPARTFPFSIFSYISYLYQKNFVLFSDEVIVGLPYWETSRSVPTTQQLVTVKKTGTSSQIIQEKSRPVLGSPMNRNLKWATQKSPLQCL